MRGGAQARLFPVDVEVSRRLGGEMRIIGFVTDHAVVVRTLSHIEHRGIYARETMGVAAKGNRPLTSVKTSVTSRLPMNRTVRDG